MKFFKAWHQAGWPGPAARCVGPLALAWRALLGPASRATVTARGSCKRGSLGLLLTLSALKPLVTGLCLSSGASGGLFTPSLSMGAALGGALGIAWNVLWPGSTQGAFAIVGAAAMIGAAMQAPLAALVLVLELTGTGFGLMVPMAAATVTATAIAFYIDGYSIYSARLSSHPPGRRPGYQPHP